MLSGGKDDCLTAALTLVFSKRTIRSELVKLRIAGVRRFVSPGGRIPRITLRNATEFLLMDRSMRSSPRSVKDDGV